MNPLDPEKLLSRVRLREVPVALRWRVLASHQRARNWVGGVERFVWSGVGVAWLVIAALHFTTPNLPTSGGGEINVAATVERWEVTRRFAQTGELPREVRRIELESLIIIKPRS